MTDAELLRGELKRVAQELGAENALEPIIERPRDPAFGDWTTNYAMVLARPLQRQARQLAAAMVERLDLRRAGLRSAEVAGPGFINFRVDPSALNAPLLDIIRRGERYGHADGGASNRVVVEFVSANPTGPLHVGHGRQAALGDAIAALLDLYRLGGESRILLQRRRRADPKPRRERGGTHRRAAGPSARDP